MLSVEDNELVTNTNPGTPMGELFRRFWLPVALSEGPGRHAEQRHAAKDQEPGVKRVQQPVAALLEDVDRAHGSNMEGSGDFAESPSITRHPDAPDVFPEASNVPVRGRGRLRLEMAVLI